MANPAELLFNLFTEWNNPRAFVKDVRADENLIKHRQALRYLDQIEQIIGILERDGMRVGVYKKFVPIWSKTIFNYPRDWQHSKAEISTHALDSLENLINHAGAVVIPIDEGRLELLGLYLESVEIALSDDSTLSDAVKISAMQAVHNVRHAIANIAVVGDYEFKSLLESLFATLASVEMKSQNKKRWAHWSDHFVWPFIYDSMKFSAGFGFSQLQNAGAFELFQRALGS